MVYPRQQISGLEEEWLIIMGPWKSYASLALSTFVFTNQFLNLQRVPEKAYCGACFLARLYDRIYILDKFCYYRGHQEDARGQTSTYGILLL